MEAKGGIFMKNQFGLRKGNPARTCLHQSSAAALLVALLLLVCAGAAHAATVSVTVAPGGELSFDPPNVTIELGDTVEWTWGSSGHSSTSGTPDSPDGIWDSGIHNAGFTFSFTFSTAGTFNYYCSPHGSCCGMVGSVTVAAPTPTPTPTATPTPAPTPVEGTMANISTRGQVEAGDNVLIGGFIIGGMQSKAVLLRAIGPSLTDLGVNGALANPVLELHEADGTLIETNDNWKTKSDGTNQQAEIEATGIAPTNDFESAILRDSLDPGLYTAVVRGVNSSTGIALVEAYDLDLDPLGTSILANISTRSFVGTTENVMIGGIIVVGANAQEVLVRAIGPSLTDLGVSGALPDPVLELHDADGTLIETNDDWKTKSDGTSQQAEIEATMTAPTNDAESAILVTLTHGLYTAIVSGKNNATGIALVEFYQIDN